MKNKDRGNDWKSRGVIFSLGFGYGLKTQIVKIRKKLFSTRQMAMISTLIFLAIGAGIYFAYDYTAKGATYGWVQSSWVGGADMGAVATHSTDQTGWTKYHSADDNISVDGDGNITMSSGTQDVEETSSSDFNEGDTSSLNTDSNEIKLGCKDDWGVAGDSLGGGVAAFCQGNTIMVAQASDISGGAEWGCYGTELSGADSDTNGEQNTQDIINGCGESGIAARLCANSTEGGYEDWFLPAKNQLNSLYNNRSAIGGFASATYWSSTENDSSIAWFQHLGTGGQGSLGKDASFRVRCLRSD